MPQPQPVNRRKRFFVELSRTQLLITIAAALFILSWVFILGIIVGRGIVADTITNAMKSQIAKLQQEKKALMDKYMPSEKPAAVPQGDILKPQLDFYDQLGKKNQEHVVMTAPKPTPPPPQTGAATVMTAPAAEKQAEPGLSRTPASAPAPVTTPTQASTPTPTPAPVRVPASPAPVMETPTTAKTTEPVAGKAPALPPAAKVKKEPASTAAETVGAFILQIGSYHEESSAQSVAQRLSSKGYQPKVSSKDIPEKGGKWFRVRIGPFKTRTEADQVLNKLEQDGFQGMVISKKD